MDRKKDLLIRLRRKSLVILLFLLGAWLSSAWFVLRGTADARADVGNLDVYVYVYDLEVSQAGGDPDILGDVADLQLGLNPIAGFSFEEEGDLTATPPQYRDLHPYGDPVIKVDNWQPNDYEAKYISIRNHGTLKARLKVFFDGWNVEGHLDEALLYDFIPLEEDTSTPPKLKISSTYTPKWRRMTDLSQIDSLPPFALDIGEQQDYLLVYKFPYGSGNFYQAGGLYLADIKVVTTQDRDDAADDIFQAYAP